MEEKKVGYISLTGSAAQMGSLVLYSAHFYYEITPNHLIAAIISIQLTTQTVTINTSANSEG